MIAQKPFKLESTVQWNWMGRSVRGSIKRIYYKPVTKTLRGTVFKRNGSLAMPAYLVKSEGGNEVLKLHSELKKAP